MQYLTASLEDYIEIIYVLSQNSSGVGVTDVAKALGISKPSVNRAIRALKLKNLVIQEKYGKITLTPMGKSIANTVYSKHRMLRDFFAVVLGVSNETAESDACKIEHMLSDETFGMIEKILMMRDSKSCSIKNKKRKSMKLT